MDSTDRVGDTGGAAARRTSRSAGGKRGGVGQARAETPERAAKAGSAAHDGATATTTGDLQHITAVCSDAYSTAIECWTDLTQHCKVTNTAVLQQMDIGDSSDANSCQICMLFCTDLTTQLHGASTGGGTVLS